MLCDGVASLVANINETAWLELCQKPLANVRSSRNDLKSQGDGAIQNAKANESKRSNGQQICTATVLASLIKRETRMPSNCFRFD